jgi:hypothetical protein
MSRKHYLLALAVLLSIPVVTILGGWLAIAIDPEIARGHANYARDFRLLSLLKISVMAGTALVDGCLWLACCALVLKAKSRSYWWLPLAILGPFGLVALTLPRDLAPRAADSYQRFILGMRPLVRLAYEVAVFVIVWVLAYQAMVLWRNAQILAESIRTGVPVATIVEAQNASGGMWAFSEGLEVLFLVALLYLAWPVCFNAVKLLRKSSLRS